MMSKQLTMPNNYGVAMDKKKNWEASPRTVPVKNCLAASFLQMLPTLDGQSAEHDVALTSFPTNL